MDVLIIGCGYLGFELGRQITADGHSVVGVRRSTSGLEAVRDAGFSAARADVTDPSTLASLPDADWVVYAASVGRTSDQSARDIYVDGLAATISEFASRPDAPTRLVYTSSTGVYGDRDGEPVDEATALTPESDRQRVLVEAEDVAIIEAANAGIDGTVARLGGMYGPDRYRIDRYLDGPVTEGHVNLIHRDDAAGAIRYLLESDLARGKIVQVVDDEPADRVELAHWLADQLDEPKPATRSRAEFRADESIPDSAKQRLLADKRCQNHFLRELGYELAYPTYRHGYERAIAQRLASSK